MWTCPKCQERLDDGFDSCWNCGTSRAGEEDPDFAAEVPAYRPDPSERPPLDCLRCRRELDYLGTRNFHEGTRWGVLGELGDLFVNRESFDVYVCSNCGHVELFVSGMGEAPADE